MRIVATVFIVLLVAGCTAAPGPAEAVTPDSAPDQASTVVVTPVDSAGEVQGGRGLVKGRVTALNGSPLLGVRVELVGVADIAVTDNVGTYAIASLTAGDYLLNARHDQHAPASAQVTILPGATTVADIRLAPLGPGEPELADFWQGRDRVRVADGVFSGSDARTASQCLAGAKTRWSPMPTLRFDEPRQLVWPGTSEIIVTLDWDDGTYAGDELAVVWRNHPDGNYELTPMTPKGQPIQISLLPEQADLPRQSYTRWELGVCAKDQSGAPVQRTENFDGSVRAQVDLVRGHPLPRLTPEPTLWSGTTRLPVLDETRSFGLADPTVWIVQPCNGPVAGHDTLTADAAWWRFAPAQGLLVPPGTAAIETTLQWASTDLVASPNLEFAYRSASIAPWIPDGPATHTPLEPAESAPGQNTYRFSVGEEDLDGWDDARSSWSFLWSLSDGSPHVCSDLEIRLSVTAVREIGPQ